MRPLTLALLLAVGSAVPPARGSPGPAGNTRGTDAARTGSTQDPAYYFLLGRHLEGEGKVDEAIAAHKQAIALAPKSAELRAELAGLYARNDKAQEAIETAQAALAIDPDNQEANKILGTIYAALVGPATADRSRATILPTIPRARSPRSRRPGPRTTPSTSTSI